MLEALPNQKSYSGAMGLCDGGHFSPYVNGFLLVFTGSEQSVGRAQSNERKKTPISPPPPRLVSASPSQVLWRERVLLACRLMNEQEKTLYFIVVLFL